MKNVKFPDSITIRLSYKDRDRLKKLIGADGLFTEHGLARYCFLAGLELVENQGITIVSKIKRK